MACACVDHLVKLAAAPLMIPARPNKWEEFIGFQDKFLRKITDKLAKGEITPTQWHLAMDNWLREGHTQAHVIGQHFSGLDHAIQGLADHRGQGIADLQSYYLTGFHNDVRLGKFGTPGADDFRDDALYYRSRMYMGAMRGTAGMGFVDVSGATAEFQWILGPNEEHCPECPEIAAGGPYYKSTLYTTPAAGDTPCLGYCVVGGHQRVWTRRGLVPISDVTDRDQVLTHTGLFQKVKLAWSWRVEQETPAYSVIGPDGETCEFTGTHRMLTPSGWVDCENAQADKLPVYTAGHAKALRLLREIDACGSETGHLQGLRFDLPLRQGQGLSGERVYVVREEKGRIVSMEHQREAGIIDGGTGGQWRETSQDLCGFDPGILHDAQGGRSPLHVLLGRWPDALRVPLSMDLQASSRGDRGRDGSSPHQRRPLGRQAGKLATLETGRAHEIAREAIDRAIQAAGMDVPAVRESVQDVAALYRPTAKVLFSRMLQRGTQVFDLQVEGDESFIVEGLVAHNCQCHLQRNDGATSPMAIQFAA